MKKIFNLFKITFFILFLVTTCGCDNKETMNTKKFTEIMLKKGYSVSDVTEQYKSISYLKEASTINNDENWQFDFYVLDSNESAIKIYNNNVDTFKYLKNEDSKETSTKDGNCIKYTIIYDDSYGVVSIVDNTMVYINASKTYQDEINNILNDIGY